jgi:hypothetical protein
MIKTKPIARAIQHVYPLSSKRDTTRATALLECGHTVTGKTAELKVGGHAGCLVCVHVKKAVPRSVSYVELVAIVRLHEKRITDLENRNIVAEVKAADFTPGEHHEE